MKSLCTMSDASAFCYAANRAAGNKHDMHSDQKEEQRRRSTSAQHAKKKSVRISQIVRRTGLPDERSEEEEATEMCTCDRGAGVSRMCEHTSKSRTTSDQRTDPRSGRGDSFLLRVVAKLSVIKKPLLCSPTDRPQGQHVGLFP